MPRFNPWLGCEKVSPACAHCYAETLAVNRMGLSGDKSVWGKDAARRVTSASTWAKPLAWNRESEANGRRLFGGREDERIRVFCASMADVFEERADLEEPRARLFELIEATPALDWLILTKRPTFARAWLFDYYARRGMHRWTGRDAIGWGLLPNVWMGVSIENQAWTWRADVLREIPSVVRFVSAEPLVASLTTWRGARTSIGAGRRAPLDLAGIDWLIVGGESGGRGSRPMHPTWARELRDEALERGIALHFKQWGSYGPAPSDDGVRPGDICWSLEEDGYSEKYVADRDYVCASNESIGEWIRYYGPTPKAGGKLLDDVEYCEFPTTGIRIGA